MNDTDEKRIFRWEIEDGEISIKETRDYIEVTPKGRLKVTPNFTTDKFITASTLKEFEDEIYDLASRFFGHWESEAWFDGWGLSENFLGRATIKDAN